MTFLGVGSAFAKRNYNANILFELWRDEWDGNVPPTPPDDTLLVDFGVTGPLALYALKERPGFEYLRTPSGGISYPAIRKVFITHQHADHIGGLEEMALMNTFVFNDRNTGKPHKPEVISTINILVNLWDHSLKGGLNTIQNRYALLQDYFFIRALIACKPGHNTFSVGPYVFEIFPTDHVHIERKYDWPSYGLFVSNPKGGAAFYSGDTRFDYPAYMRMMERATICFHDCQLFDQQESVHATLSECRTLPAAIKQKTLLYHYGDGFDDKALAPALAEFKGLARPQERYHLFPVRPDRSPDRPLT
ncbi:MAG: MBL fold metallo-hydrolase [Planctomycetota bacterium]|nr:MBL fold metallo-hydrolase [Planctomycetota bacterium]